MVVSNMCVKHFVVILFWADLLLCSLHSAPKIVSEYDQEIPQSQTAGNPMAPRGRAAQPS